MSISKGSLTRWNESSGGIFFPEELEMIGGLYLEDTAQVQGIVTLIETPEDAKPEQRREASRILVPPGKNLIVSLGRESIRKLMAVTAEANASPGHRDLGYLAVGNGVLTPVPGTLGLVSETTLWPGPAVGDRPVRPQLTVTAPAPGPPFTSNLWTAQIGSAQLVGGTTVGGTTDAQISEAALYSLDAAGTFIFAARGFAAQTHSAGYALEARWLIIH